MRGLRPPPRCPHRPLALRSRPTGSRRCRTRELADCPRPIRATVPTRHSHRIPAPKPHRRGTAPITCSTAMDLDHLDWPFFSRARIASWPTGSSTWVGDNLTAFEADEGGDGRTARVVFELLARDQWLEMSLPRGTGGNDVLDLRTMSIIRERCAYSSAIYGMLPSPNLGSASCQSRYSARKHCGRRTCGNTSLASFYRRLRSRNPRLAQTPPQITTTARRQGSHYVLCGRKTWTSNCGLADLYIVFARLDDGRNYCVCGGRTYRGHQAR